MKRMGKYKESSFWGVKGTRGKVVKLRDSPFPFQEDFVNSFGWYQPATGKNTRST
jgi:hypothetical protein